VTAVDSSRILELGSATTSGLDAVEAGAKRRAIIEIVARRETIEFPNREGSASLAGTAIQRIAVDRICNELDA